MNENEADIDAEESDVPEMALNALREAQRRALASGREVVVVRDRKLVRVNASGEVVVLKTLPPLEKIADRFKQAKS